MFAAFSVYVVCFLFIFEEGLTGKSEWSALQAAYHRTRHDKVSHLLLEESHDGYWTVGILNSRKTDRIWFLLNPGFGQCDKTFGADHKEEEEDFNLNADEMRTIAATPNARRSVLGRLREHVR